MTNTTAPPHDAVQAIAYQCRGLSVELRGRRQARPILDGIDLDLHDGDLVAVVGRSGSGKSTLLRALGGLLTPDPGAVVTFYGRPVDGPPQDVAFVFQDYAASLLPWRSVRRNVALGLESRVSPQELPSRVAEALTLVGLEHRGDDFPWQLSGGMQQRVQLARALALRPRGMLMDEPFGSLDALTKAALQDQLLLIHQRTRPTIVFVTHDIDEAVFLSDRVLVLNGAPAAVTHDIPVALPRPRDQLATRELPAFLRLRREVHAAVTGQ